MEAGGPSFTSRARYFEPCSLTASGSNVGKGNGRTETRGGSAAANLLNIEGNQKRRDPGSVLKVETVIVIGIKSGRSKDAAVLLELRVVL